MNEITATISQATQILKFQLQLLWEKPTLAKEIGPCLLWGSPGIGKSTLIKDLCSEMGIGFIDIRLSQKEPVDFSGIPVPLPAGNEVRWLLSSEWPRQGRGIILFDELSSCDRSIQTAAYEFILDRKLGQEYKLPDGWLIVGAGNKSTDKAVSMPISSALANRFCHIELQADLNQWVHWAVNKGLNPDVIAFLKYKPECFFNMNGNLERGWPSPRSWERVAIAVEHAGGLSPDALAIIVHGLVGIGAGIEFLAFRKNAAELQDINALLLGEVEFKMPQRADQLYALSTGLAYYVYKGTAQEQEVRMTNFLRIGIQLSSDFAVMSITNAIAKFTSPTEKLTERVKTGMGSALFANPKFSCWVDKHGEVWAHHESGSVQKSNQMTNVLNRKVPKSKNSNSLGGIRGALSGGHLSSSLNGSAGVI